MCIPHPKLVRAVLLRECDECVSTSLQTHAHTREPATKSLRWESKHSLTSQTNKGRLLGLPESIIWAYVSRVLSLPLSLFSPRVLDYHNVRVNEV